MERYEKSEIHFVSNTGGLSGEEIARLSDEELAAYLQKCHYAEEKKRYRVKPGFVLREIAGEYAIVPVGGDNPLANAMMIPNDTAAFLWRVFQQPGTIEDAVRKGMEEYDVSREILRSAAERFIAESLRNQIAEEVM